MGWNMRSRPAWCADRATSDRVDRRAFCATAPGGWTACCCWRRIVPPRVRDHGRLKEIAELAAAMRGSAELALESTAQGAAFLKAIGTRLAASRRRAAVAGARRTRRACRTRSRSARRPPLPASRKRPSCRPISPSSAAISSPPPCASRRSAKATASRRSRCWSRRSPRQVERLRAAPFETIGAASLMVDWCSMKHETQETRLFRS